MSLSLFASVLPSQRRLQAQAAARNAAPSPYDAEAALLRCVPSDLLAPAEKRAPRWHVQYAPRATPVQGAFSLQTAKASCVGNHGPAWLEEIKSICHRNDFAVSAFGICAFAVITNKLAAGEALSWNMLAVGTYVGAALYARKTGTTNSEQAYAALGRCRLAEGDNAGAEEAFFRAPSYGGALLGLVEARRRQGKWQAAADALERLENIGEFPDALEDEMMAQAALLNQTSAQPAWFAPSEVRR